MATDQIRNIFSFEDDVIMLKWLYVKLNQSDKDAKKPLGYRIWHTLLKEKAEGLVNFSAQSLSTHMRRIMFKRFDIYSDYLPRKVFKYLVREYQPYFRPVLQLSDDDSESKPDKIAEENILPKKEKKTSPEKSPVKKTLAGDKQPETSKSTGKDKLVPPKKTLVPLMTDEERQAVRALGRKVINVAFESWPDAAAPKATSQRQTGEKRDSEDLAFPVIAGEHVSVCVCGVPLWEVEKLLQQDDSWVATEDAVAHLKRALKLTALIGRLCQQNEKSIGRLLQWLLDNRLEGLTVGRVVDEILRPDP